MVVAPRRDLIATIVAIGALIALLYALPLSAQQGQMHQRHPASADVALVNQGASIGTTNLIVTAPAGIYNVCWVQQITRAATVSSSLLTTIGWNNGSSKTSSMVSINGGLLQLTADTANVLNSTGNSCIMVYSADGQPITYSTAYASVGATSMQYALFITAERLQ